MTIELYNDQIKVKHLLKADPFGQVITVYNRESAKAKSLVEDSNDFFKHIYVEANGGLVVNGIYRNGLTIDKWLAENNNFSESLNCMLFLIEGYAGCGKSTLVQHILYEVLGNPNYEYSYYNYDIGFCPEDNEDEQEESSMDSIKYSIIFELKKQIITILDTEECNNILDKFIFLMEDESSLTKLDSSLEIRRKFGASRSFITSVKSVFNNDGSYRYLAIKELETVIEEQLSMLTIYQLLCVDYLWRLSQFLVDPRSYRKYMYVCYDNLDSIMNIGVLYRFKETLILFRENLNAYTAQLNKNIREQRNTYGVKSIQAFIIFATYRKITAIRSNSRNTEMIEDMLACSEYIQTVEISKQYNFTNIAQKRIDHFSQKFLTTDICGSRAEKLIIQMEKIKQVRKMSFVRTTYAGLWNNNFRACSNVLSELVEHNSNDINMCISLYSKNIDGFNQERYCYYGASSLFLHAICKMLKRMNIFDENHLDLINIKEDALNRNTSLSRLIITYLYTFNDSVPITKLFDVFDKVFEPEYICKILGQLIKRVTGEIWRRPIYYSKYALDNENDIQNELYRQYQMYKDKERYKYVEFRICDCGATYINTVVPQFEFYSVRINENNPNLYNINTVEILNEVLNNVYEKIEVCCKKQIEFAKNYMEKYNLDKADYMNLNFHPRTRGGNPQLHIERVIFSHMEYFNRYRMYLISKKNIYKYDAFNDILLGYIGKYLSLYEKYITQICSDRNEVANKLHAKLELANNGNKYIPIEV